MVSPLLSHMCSDGKGSSLNKPDKIVPCEWSHGIQSRNTSDLMSEVVDIKIALPGCSCDLSCRRGEEGEVRGGSNQHKYERHLKGYIIVKYDPPVLEYLFDACPTVHLVKSLLHTPHHLVNLPVLRVHAMG